MRFRQTVVLPSVVELRQIVGVAGITRLLLHPNEPKIGFVGKRHETTLENVVWAIELFAAKLRFINKRQEKHELYALFYQIVIFIEETFSFNSKIQRTYHKL
jgi:predicted nucleotidyltransferase component of viral defense system